MVSQLDCRCKYDLLPPPYLEVCGNCRPGCLSEIDANMSPQQLPACIPMGIRMMEYVHAVSSLAWIHLVIYSLSYFCFLLLNCVECHLSSFSFMDPLLWFNNCCMLTPLWCPLFIFLASWSCVCVRSSMYELLKWKLSSCSLGAFIS